MKARLEELICVKADEHRWEIVAPQVMPDHVHLFAEPYPQNSPSYVAGQFKGFTSHHLRAEFGGLRSQLPTLWSRSCFVATVGAVSAETVRRHIETRYQRAPQAGGRA